MTSLLALALLVTSQTAAGPERPFNGRDLDGWVAKENSGPADAWKVGGPSLDPENKRKFVLGRGDAMVNDIVQHGQSRDFYSKAVYGDQWITLEVMVPQGSNSGIYVQGEYEVQVLDSFGKDANPGPGDMGALYGAQPPKNPKYKAPGEWNTVDIRFQAPRFDASGKKVENARFIRVELNGGVIHENVEMKSQTPGGVDGKEKAMGPLMFQGNHGPVAFRNIRIRPLPAR